MKRNKKDSLKTSQAVVANVDAFSQWATVPKFAGRWGGASKQLEDKLPEHPAVTAPQPQIKPKTGKFDVGSTAPKNVQQYTGTKMRGIGQMHKSNAVPTFDPETAIELAHMRR